MKTIEAALKAIDQSGNLRRIPADSSHSSCIDFSSNDYLGVASRSDLREEFFSHIDANELLMTSSASRLLSRHQRAYTEFEQFLESIYGRKALIFNSGYHANTGLVSALAGKDYTIIADKLVHASIIDGIKLSGAPFERFRHNDMAHLELLVRKAQQQGRKILIIVESVYSMDGDQAPLEEIAAIKCRYDNTLLYVDEAHAVGVEGPAGLGLTMASDSIKQAVDITIGTLGKALGSVGAYAICNDTLHNWAVNRARSLIFSTALPPANILWSKFIFEKSILMDSERAWLKKIGLRLGTILNNGSNSHIQAFITGDPLKALHASATLKAQGLEVLPIRTPTVPPGTDRLRISLSASHSMTDIEQLGEALKRYKNE